MRAVFAALRFVLVPCLAVLAVACDRDASRAPTSDTAADTTPTVAATPAPDTARPVFAIDIWPGEGRALLESATDTIVLHRQPSPASPVTHRMATTVGQRLTYDSTVFQTMEPGRLRVLAPFNIRARVVGNVTRLSRQRYYSTQFQLTSIPVDTSSRLEFLQYRAEGSCFIRLDSRVLEAQDCPATNRIEFSLDEEPVTRRWARIVIDERRGGWALVEDVKIIIAGRQF